LKYKRGKIYRLSAPSDGRDVQSNVIARYPIGLPVVFDRELPDRIEVVEPHGHVVQLPLVPVWRIGQNVDIFKEGLKLMRQDLPSILEEYPSEDKAKKEWERYTHPEKYRWYVAKLNKKYGTCYCDFEAMISIPKRTIQTILDEISRNLYLKENDELYQAVADISLLIAAGDGGDIETKQDEEYVRTIVFAVHELLTTKYYVKSGCHWDFENRKFVCDDLEVKVDGRT